MENEARNDWGVVFDQEEEDTLSFCNLNLQDQSAIHSPRAASSVSSPQHQFFEFSNEFPSSPEDGYHSAPEIVFCGKVIDQKESEDEEEQLNEFQKRDYLTMVKSSKKPPTYDLSPFLICNKNNNESHDHHQEPRSNSSSPRKPGTPSLKLPGSGNQVQKVNITSLTSMSTKSRRRMFMFGPVKFKPEMELSAIKERQGKRLTTLLSPAATVSEDGNVVVKEADGGKGRSHWGVVKSSLRGRAHLSDVLAKSFVFGCMRAAAPAGGNWIKVSN